MLEVEVSSSMPRKPEREVGLRVQMSDRLPNSFLRAFYEIRKDARNLRLHDWRMDAALPPHTLHFNVTDRCNALCSFCVYRLHKAEGVMPIEVYEKALREFKRMGGRSIGFNPLVGEPLLDPLLLERIRMAKELGIGHVFLFTNGIALNQEGMVGRLLHSGLDEINLSIYAFSPSAFRKTMGVDKYEEFIEGVRALLLAKRRLGGQVRIAMYMRGRSRDFFTADFRERVLPLLDSEFMRSNVFFPRLYDNWVGQIEKADLPPGSDFYPKGGIRRRPCDRTFEIAVLTNGDVRACDCRFGKGGKHDALVIGNIKSAGLEEMWRGERLAKLRNSFGKGVAPNVCKECNDYNPR